MFNQILRKAFLAGRTAFYSQAVNPYRNAKLRAAWDDGFCTECEAFA